MVQQIFWKVFLWNLEVKTEKKIPGKTIILVKRNQDGKHALFSYSNNLKKMNVTDFFSDLIMLCYFFKSFGVMLGTKKVGRGPTIDVPLTCVGIGVLDAHTITMHPVITSLPPLTLTCTFPLSLPLPLNFGPLPPPLTIKPIAIAIHHLIGLAIKFNIAHRTLVTRLL